MRRARGGALDLEAADPDLRSLGNLAGTCRALAVWADANVADPRAADAFLRTYGLGRMPETRLAIGRSLRSPSGRRGISPAAVDALVRATEAQLDRQLDGVAFPRPWGSPTPTAWADPFPDAASRPAVRRQLRQVLATAWADVPDEPVHDCRAALLLYEQEHGLRSGLALVHHREQRRRLRRLAWSMLTVARERQVGKEPDDVLVDLLLGPRRLAVIDLLPEAAAALLLTGAAAEPASLAAALDHVRDAVRHGRPEAPELLGLLRECIARSMAEAVPPAITAGVAALATILAREHGHSSGVLAASEAVMLAREAGARLARLPAASASEREAQTRAVHDGLRAAQEAAELQDLLGDGVGARRSLRTMGALAAGLDAGDRSEVEGWRQQRLQSRASVARHRALSGRHGDLWLRQAEHDASRSLDLAESEGLPAGYRLVPSSQLVAVALAWLRLTPAGARSRASLEERARRALRDAADLSAMVTGTADRPTHSARLSVARRWWELALLCGDVDEVITARNAAHDLVRPSTLHHDVHKLDRLEWRSRARGVPDAALATEMGEVGD